MLNIPTTDSAARPRSLRRAAALAALFALCTGTAQAALVRVDFTGTNTGSAGQTSVFGTNATVADLSGYFVFDDATAGAPFSTTAFNYAAALKELSFRIGNAGNPTVMSGLRTGNFGNVQVRNPAGNDGLSFDTLAGGLSPGNLVGEVPTVVNGPLTRSFQSAQFVFQLTGANTVLGSTSLGAATPTLTTANWLGSPLPDNVQLSLSYAQSGTGTAPGSWPAQNFNYALTSFSVAPVPLPAAGWLMVAGLTALAAAARRKARV